MPAVNAPSYAKFYINCPHCGTDLTEKKSIYQNARWSKRADGTPRRYYYYAYAYANTKRIYYNRSNYVNTTTGHFCSACNRNLPVEGSDHSYYKFNRT